MSSKRAGDTRRGKQTEQQPPHSRHRPRHCHGQARQIHLVSRRQLIRSGQRFSSPFQAGLLKDRSGFEDMQRFSRPLQDEASQAGHTHLVSRLARRGMESYFEVIRKKAQTKARQQTMDTIMEANTETKRQKKKDKVHSRGTRQ